MRGYNLFFKILKANIFAISAYLLILVLSSFIFGLSNEQVKTRQMIVAPVYYVEINDELINNLPEDNTKVFEYLLEKDLLLIKTDDVLTNGLVEYSKEYLNPKDIDPKYADDANYCGLIHGALILPSNLSKIDRNSTIYFFHTRLRDASQVAPLHLAIGKYLNVYHNLTELYNENNITYNENEVVEKISATLVNNVNLDLSSPVDLKVKIMGYYFNFSTYIISSIIIMIVCIIIFEIKRSEVFKRISLSSYNKTKFIIEILLASLLTAFLLVGIVFLTSIITNPTTLTISGVYYLINLLVFVLPLTSVSVFLGLVIDKQELVSMLSTVLALAQGFFTGSFIPAELLSNGILALGKIFPAAYAVKINDLISEQLSSNLGPILINGGIMILYAAIFVVLSLIIFKRRVKKE
ncbi:MAG: ABC transporter permease [Acholeplasmataceae bacterium]|nr:ABC transporter permease [Acholeplasmataceae bacterium]